jgi:hypothetical protein
MRVVPERRLLIVTHRCQPYGRPDTLRATHRRSGGLLPPIADSIARPRPVRLPEWLGDSAKWANSRPTPARKQSKMEAAGGPID